MKYFPLESESASFSLTPHLQHPKASSLLLFSFGTGERKEEKQERDRRDKVKFLRKAVFLVQASCSDACSNQACNPAHYLLNIYCMI